MAIKSAAVVLILSYFRWIKDADFSECFGSKVNVQSEKKNKIKKIDSSLVGDAVQQGRINTELMHHCIGEGPIFSPGLHQIIQTAGSK